MRIAIAGFILALNITAGESIAADNLPLTVSQLRQEREMRPRRLAELVAGFRYEFRAAVQDPDAFLARKSGDCDDFAVLADLVLSERGYQTRLVHVRLVGRVGHTVCYVTESQGYLDYNNRRYLFKIARSGPSLREIAEKVANSLDANWTSVSEFSFDSTTGGKSVVRTIAKVQALSPD